MMIIAFIFLTDDKKKVSLAHKSLMSDLGLSQIFGAKGIFSSILFGAYYKLSYLCTRK